MHAQLVPPVPKPPYHRNCEKGDILQQLNNFTSYRLHVKPHAKEREKTKATSRVVRRDNVKNLTWSHRFQLQPVLNSISTEWTPTRFEPY